MPEAREQAVRLVLEGSGEHPTQWATIDSVAVKVGHTADALRPWVRQEDRGKETRTTVPDKRTPCPTDRVNRRFLAPRPNALRVVVRVVDCACFAT